MVEELLEERREKIEELELKYHLNDTLYKKFQELVGLFQEKNLDYQLVGDFAISLKYKDEFSTSIDYIQINLSEQDIEKLYEICKQLKLKLQDKRMYSDKTLKDGEIVGDNEVVVYHENKPLLMVHCFERLVDGTIIAKDYYLDGDDNPRARETIYSSKLSKEIFGRDSIDFFGYVVPIVSLEYLFILKNMDKQLLEFIETKIDNRRVSTIRNLLRTDKVVQFVLVNDLDKTSTGILEIDNNDISHILLEAQNNDLNETQNLEFLKKKLIHKNDIVNETGFSNVYIIVIIVLVILVLLVMGLIVFKLVR